MRQPLGQHFLKDERVLDKIVSVLNVSQNDTVIEIGPGHGELTGRILKNSPQKLIAIEKDKELVSSIQHLVASNNNLEIIVGDALQILPTIHETYNLSPGGYKLIGNIPYYITGRLLRVIGGLENKPSFVVLTIQKEVAERLCAIPPKMNLLAASVSFWGVPKIIRNISRNAFRPRPQVESSIIEISLLDIQKSEEESKKYYKFIKALFKQPRKTVANNLIDGFKKPRIDVESFLKLNGVEPNLRPHDLSIDTINNLSQSFFAKEL